jgi:hypothetical protein
MSTNEIDGTTAVSRKAAEIEEFPMDLVLLSEKSSFGWRRQKPWRNDWALLRIKLPFCGAKEFCWIDNFQNPLLLLGQFLPNPAAQRNKVPRLFGS